MVTQVFSICTETVIFKVLLRLTKEQNYHGVVILEVVIVRSYEISALKLS